MPRVLTSLVAVMLSAAWVVVTGYSTLIAPQQEGAHAGPSSVTVAGVVAILGLAALGGVSALAALVACLSGRRLKVAWLLIMLTLPLAGAWLVAMGTELFACNPDAGNCAGQ